MSAKRSQLRQGRRIKSLHRATVEPLEVRRLLAAVSWTGTVSNAWENPLNWSNLAAPTSVDDVTVGTGSVAPVISTGDQQIRSITTASGQTLNITGGSLQTSAESHVMGDLSLSGGRLVAASDVLYIQGTTTWSGGTIASGSGGEVRNVGFVNLQGAAQKTLDGRLVNSGTANSGDIQHWGTGNLMMASGSQLVNQMLYTFRSGADIVADPSASVRPQFTQLGSGFLAKMGVGTTSTIDGSIDFSSDSSVRSYEGVLEILDGDIPQFSSTISEGLWAAEGGTLSLPNVPSPNAVGMFANVQVRGPAGSFPQLESISLNAGALVVREGATLSLDGNLTNHATLSLATAAVLNVPGNFTTSSGGDLYQDRATGQFAMMNVGGQVSLAGDLWVNGNTPAIGESFTIINKQSSGAISGTFNGLPEGATISTYDPGIVYQISYVGGDGNDVTLTARGPNATPTANAGGPYTVVEGSTVQLSSAGSSDSDGSIVSYAWDLDYSDGYFSVENTSASPSFYGADGPSTRTVALRVTDNNGATSSISTATVSITNDPPRAGISGPATAIAGQPTTFFVNGTDASAADRAAGFTYSIDWDGDGTTDQTVVGVGELQVTHTFATAGNYNMNARATDKDGTTGNWSATPITVIAANQAPVAAGDSYSTVAGTTLNVAAPGVLANDTDGDGNPITAVLVSGPANGILTLNTDGSFSYTPAAGFAGSDSFTYKANDGSADSAAATVSLSVTNLVRHRQPVGDEPGSGGEW